MEQNFEINDRTLHKHTTYDQIEYLIQCLSIANYIELDSGENGLVRVYVISLKHPRY